VTTSTHLPGTRPADDLLLKVTPPRVPRHLVTRSRLLGGDARLRDQPVVLVQAPAGFGKTSLLAQWRREHLAHGAVVAWLLAQPQDNPRRLVQALALAVRVGAARPGFGHTLLEAASPAGLEGITTWLAEVAQTALDVVLTCCATRRPTCAWWWPHAATAPCIWTT
jgi:LuxR family maltose regulon positive regulatory protein